MKSHKRGFANILAVLVLVAVLGLGGYAYYRQTPVAPDNTGGGVACTMEAKLCPDGSYVGRQGPNCEFALCPSTPVSTVPADWKTYSNAQYGFEFKYPSEWAITYDGGLQPNYGGGIVYTTNNEDFSHGLLSVTASDFKPDGMGSGISFYGSPTELDQKLDCVKYQYISCKKLVIDGRNAMDVTLSFGVEGGGRNTARYVAINNPYSRFNSIAFEVTPNSKQSVILDSILPTFRFIK